MATRLPALRADGVDTGIGKPLRLLGRRHRADHERAGGMHSVHVGAWVSPGERDDARSGCERRLETLLRRPLEQDVDVERLRRTGLHVVEHGRHVFRLRPAQRDGPERPGLGDRRGEGRHGRTADRRLDDRHVDPEQVTERRAHPAQATDGTSAKARSTSSTSGPS
jgi:hypothetical protein